MCKRFFCLLAVLAIAGSANAALLAHYDFGTTTGGTVNQGTVGAAGDGILENGPVFVDIDPGPGTEWALKFVQNGSHQRMRIPAPWFPPDGHPFTVAAWLQAPLDTPCDWATIASKGYESAWHLATGTPQGLGSDKVVFAVHGAVAAWSPLKGTVSVRNDTYWFHVIGTVDAQDYTTTCLYINGVLQESRQTWGAVYTNDLDIFLGDEPLRPEDDYAWNGMIDDFRIYDSHIDAAGAMDLFVNSYREVRPTIPEPATIALLVLGGLAVLGRKR